MTTNNAPLVLAERDNGIARLTLNRGARHNALVPDLLTALRDALAELRRDPPRVLILAAAGRSFSTGGDVGAFYDTPPAQRYDYAARVVGELNAAILDLLTLPCPTVAAVHGTVTGGSVGLVLACDIAVGGPRTHFAPWYTVVGFSPDGGWSALMPERIGRARALDAQLTNRAIDADEALRLGLLQYLADDNGVLDQANAIAATIAAAKPASVAHTLTLNRPDSQRVAAGLEAEYRHFLEQIVSDEADRGMKAFLER
ncbi:enoyl-CoA hydratase [Alcanivorax sp. N3-2A]|nr:enoyl-CoA hydratase [Alcanivorax sp. N3-2A]|tara:strand:+ start:14582 stop:15352 length:771 start_codon:yes stop_codon:yes gene_type:complete